MCQQCDHPHELFGITVLFPVDDEHDFFRIDKIMPLIEVGVKNHGRCPDCLSTEALIPNFEARMWIYSIEHAQSCPRAGMIEQHQNGA